MTNAHEPEEDVVTGKKRKRKSESKRKGQILTYDSTITDDYYGGFSYSFGKRIRGQESEGQEEEMEECEEKEEEREGKKKEMEEIEEKEDEGKEESKGTEEASKKETKEGEGKKEESKEDSEGKEEESKQETEECEGKEESKEESEEKEEAIEEKDKESEKEEAREKKEGKDEVTPFTITTGIQLRKTFPAKVRQEPCVETPSTDPPTKRGCGRERGRGRERGKGKGKAREQPVDESPSSGEKVALEASRQEGNDGEFVWRPAGQVMNSIFRTHSFVEPNS